MPAHEPAAHMPPPPETLSAEARAYLGSLAPLDPSQPIDVAAMRPFTEQIQALVGAEQRKAHAVTVTEDVIAGVPVRRIAPGFGRGRSQPDPCSMCMGGEASRRILVP